MANYIYLMDKLEGEYKEAFDKVYIYTSVRNMEGETEQEMMMNLLDMMLTAQHEGKPVDKIIGNDVEKFCDSYFEGYDYKVRLTDQLPKCLNRIMWFVFIFEMLDVVFSVSEKDFNLLKETVDVSGYAVGMICAVVIVLVMVFVKPFMFQWKKISAKIFDFAVIILTFAVVILGLVVVGEREWNVPVFPILVVSGAYIFIYKIVQMIRRYQKYGTVWKRKEPFRESWFGRINAEVDRQLPGEFVKQYEKKNKRLIRRGKEPMTIEEYMEKMEKENKRIDTWVLSVVVVCAIVIVGYSIYIMMDESVMDGLLFAAIMFAVETPIFVWMLRITKPRKRMLAECEKQGITMIEYAEMQKNNIADEEN